MMRHRRRQHRQHLLAHDLGDRFVTVCGRSLAADRWLLRMVRQNFFVLQRPNVPVPLCQQCAPKLKPPSDAR